MGIMEYRLPQRPLAPPERTPRQERANALCYRYEELRDQRALLDEALLEIQYELEELGYGNLR